MGDLIMEIEYELTIDDLLNYEMYQHDHFKYTRRLRLIFQFLLPIILFVVLVYIILAKNHQIFIDIGLAVIFGVVSVIWFILFPSKFREQLKKVGRKLIEEGRNKTKLCNRRMVFTPEGISSASEFWESKTYWKAIDRFVSTDDYVYIFISTTGAIIIPKRVFHDESQYEEFLQILKDNVQDVVD